MNLKTLMNNVTAFLTAGMAMALITACASAPKGSISATATPADEVTRIEQELEQGYGNHLDVLASKDFKNTQKQLEKAREAIKDGDSQKDIIEELVAAQGYLDRAKSTAAGRTDKLKGVLDARSAAISAGAKKFPKEARVMRELDEDLVDGANDIGDVTPDMYSEMQRGYQALQIQAVQENQLGKSRAWINNSKDRKAEKRAPKTLATAQKDLMSAENLITSNMNNPSAYSEAVKKSYNSARFLDAVMVAVVREDTVLPESAAVEIASKTFQLKEVQAQLSDTESNLAQSETTSAMQSNKLNQQGATLELDRKIKSISSMFNKQDAEVYRQGNKVLLRLKGMQFNTASSSLPQTSIALLGKVKEAIGAIDANAVVVEGHTDATGSAAVNKELSQKRAETVAEYLKTNGSEEISVEAAGYGFEKPIASNKTKNGRAQNRRVDVIITPESVASAQSPKGSSK